MWLSLVVPSWKQGKNQRLSVSDQVLAVGAGATGVARWLEPSCRPDLSVMRWLLGLVTAGCGPLSFPRLTRPRPVCLSRLSTLSLFSHFRNSDCFLQLLRDFTVLCVSSVRLWFSFFFTLRCAPVYLRTRPGGRAFGGPPHQSLSALAPPPPRASPCPSALLEAARCGGPSLSSPIH